MGKKQEETVIPWFSLLAIAARWGVEAETVKRFIQEGVRDDDGNLIRLPAYKLGRQWRVRPEDLETFEEALRSRCSTPDIAAAGS